MSPAAPLIIVKLRLSAASSTGTTPNLRGLQGGGRRGEGWNSDDDWQQPYPYRQKMLKHVQTGTNAFHGDGINCSSLAILLAGWLAMGVLLLLLLHDIGADGRQDLVRPWKWAGGLAVMSDEEDLRPKRTVP